MIPQWNLLLVENQLEIRIEILRQNRDQLQKLERWIALRSSNMAMPDNFITRLEAKVIEQLHGQGVGYLLGAGSSYLNKDGYPLAAEIWDLIKEQIKDPSKRADIQVKLDSGADGLEHALDLLDHGGAKDTPYRHLVSDAIAELFFPKNPPLDTHSEFIQRLFGRARAAVKMFSLNYDPLIERAAAEIRIRVLDGFIGAERAYFDSAIFEERIGRIRGVHKSKQFDETVRPIHLFKLHGSLGWYLCPKTGVRRCAYNSPVPSETKRLMIPPQHRKAADTMLQPYSALWSAFRGCLGQNERPLNRLASIGYGFRDEHVNAIIEPALSRTNFTLLIFTKDLSDGAWDRWSKRKEVVVVTASRCSLQGEIGPGHPDLWSFERLCKEV